MLYIIQDYQGDFRSRRSTTDQLLSAKQVLEKYWKFSTDVHQILADHERICENIDRNILYDIMFRFEISLDFDGITRGDYLTGSFIYFGAHVKKTPGRLRNKEFLLFRLWKEKGFIGRRNSTHTDLCGCLTEKLDLWQKYAVNIFEH